jgi:hypothetical protein
MGILSYQIIFFHFQGLTTQTLSKVEFITYANV